MKIFLNGLGASTASGLTYLRNVLPHLSSRTDMHTAVAVNSAVRGEFTAFPNISVLELKDPPGAAARFWFEQTRLPALLRATKAQVLISAGNFALRNPPIPQILLSGNSLYTSPDFYRDLRHRREYRMWLDTRLRAVFARRSVAWADCTVAPSLAFAGELQRWTGRDVVSIHHGFDPEIFFAGNCGLSENIDQRLKASEGALRLLYVSHYNYYRNFETIFRALPLIRRGLGGRKLRLFLTCKLQDGETPGAYKPAAALSLVRDLGIRDEVVELGSMDYSVLHHLYRACDLYVTAAYAETFAHPIAEAMACGLRIVASDLPVHHEICGESALYFPRFSPEVLADQVLRAAVLGRPEPQTSRFSWREHVKELLALAAGLVGQATEGERTATQGEIRLKHANIETRNAVRSKRPA